MKPKIFLHIGQPKTATTSSQGFFHENAGALQSEGILYPASFLQGVAHHPVGGAFMKHKADWVRLDDPAKMRKSLDEEISEKRPHTVLISTEALFYEGVDVSTVREWLSDYQVEVIVNLRQQDDWLESALRDNIKTGHFSGSIESYLQRMQGRLNYFDVLSEWGQHFGNENVKVITFEPRKGMLPPEHELLDLIGCTDPKKYGVAKKANERLSRDALAWLSLSPDVRRIGAQHFRMFHLLARWSVLNPDKPEYSNFLPPRFRQKIRESYADSNEAVARTFMNRSDGVLFQHPSEISDEWKEYGGLSAARAVAIGQWLFNATRK